MTIELQILAWTIALGLAHLLVTVPFVVAQHGLGYVVSPRDERKPLVGVGARLARAFANFLETFPLFLGAALLVNATGHQSALTTIGSWLYLLSRIAYIPLYFAGWPVIRTLTWMAAFVGICMVLAGALAV